MTSSVPSLQAVAYPTVWRVIGAALVVLSRASLPLIGVGVLTADGPIPLMVLVRTLCVCALLPALAAWLIERAFMARVEVHPTESVIESRGLRIEIPRTAIADVSPWALPLPGPGFALRMQSGRRFSYGLQLADPTALLSALAETGGVTAASAAMHRPALIYAHAKHGVVRRRWYRRLGKFVLFPLVPTAVWFYAHQHIAYGGLLGQYYLEGLSPYLKTLYISWGLAAIYLLLYASVWRAVAEGAALIAAWLAPHRATTVRWIIEIVCALVYYAGVPAIVVLPFLS